MSKENERYNLHYTKPYASAQYTVYRYNSLYSPVREVGSARSSVRTLIIVFSWLELLVSLCRSFVHIDWTLMDLRNANCTQGRIDNRLRDQMRQRKKKSYPLRKNHRNNKLRISDNFFFHPSFVNDIFHIRDQRHNVTKVRD